MSDIVYIVSSRVNYNKLICEDAGPQYAINLDWKHDTVDNASFYLNKGITIIIDTRLYEKEYDYLYKLICENPGTEFIGAITDPYYEESIDKPLYKFLFRTTTLQNVRYLTQYQPTELIAFLRNVKGEKSMLVLNYPYIKQKEVNVSLQDRKSKIIFSGSLSNGLYPERYRFWRKYTRSPWRLKIDTLQHPGYPWGDEAFAHEKVGATYINHLSRYKFMFLGASRCNLEFMKYSECAYAGCIPVGYAPGTFNSSLKKFVLPIDDKNLTKSLLKIFSVPDAELKDIAEGYRKEFSIQRDPVLLKNKVAAFLDRTLKMD